MDAVLVQRCDSMCTAHKATKQLQVFFKINFLNTCNFKVQISIWNTLVNDVKNLPP